MLLAYGVSLCDSTLVGIDIVSRILADTRIIDGVTYVLPTRHVNHVFDINMASCYHGSCGGCKVSLVCLLGK